MKGRLTIIPVTGAVSSQELAAPPHLETLQGGVGGDIELVPGLTKFGGKPCIAFCDEDGKRKNLPVNALATELWYAQVGDRYDWLVGPIVIVTGDAALMEEMESSEHTYCAVAYKIWVDRDEDLYNEGIVYWLPISELDFVKSSKESLEKEGIECHIVFGTGPRPTD